MREPTILRSADRRSISTQVFRMEAKIPRGIQIDDGGPQEPAASVVSNR